MPLDASVDAAVRRWPRCTAGRRSGGKAWCTQVYVWQGI